MHINHKADQMNKKKSAAGVGTVGELGLSLGWHSFQMYANNCTEIFRFRKLNYQGTRTNLQTYMYINIGILTQKFI